ncbi:DNA topoisomerase III [Parabacteroides goldsteinii]|uniref:type IA DNA topoisomerase n=1 Tax=Parabacteroides goldsteinii TaxID=328812 RepID=UPI0032BFEB47
MKVIIAEKPSVARDIALIVGARERKDGYMEGSGYTVTWGFGHLVGLAMPEAYGIEGFRRENLPILPQEFILIPRQIKEGKEYKNDPGVMKQLNIIKELFNRADSIIVATDAGREGCLIFRYIYHYLGCSKPFSRLWISSLTDKAIRQGMENLKDGREYDNLYRSAKARSEADWLVGINASQALCLSAGRGVFSLGRVQTPTLMMICNRYMENKNFTPQKFWQLRVQSGKDNISFAALSTGKYEKKDEAESNLQQIQSSGKLQVTAADKKEVSQEPPLLYDLTALQKEANVRHSFSADKTLSIAQSLYEKKVMSYPRTGSRYISDDVFEIIPERIRLLASYPCFAAYATALDGQFLNNRSVNAAKVTDHHALLITENLPGDLSPDERTIYEMVAARMLESFSGKCVMEKTVVTLQAAGVDFSVHGSIIKVPGWRSVLNLSDEDEQDNTTLPELQQGDTLPINNSEVLEKQTKPRPLHTESTLLAAMETAAKELENEEERQAMKEVGIGTPATRAAIIETLFSRDYIRREKKSLVPTEKGLAVHSIVKDKKIADISMTGSWESALAKIETGETDADTFHRGIEVYAAQITTELLNTTISIASATDGPVCPKCKQGHVLFFNKIAKCSDVDCSLKVFRNICNKQLTDKQITELVTKGKTSVIKGLQGKSGKTFDAALTFDAQFNVTFSFPDKGAQGKAKKKK